MTRTNQFACALGATASVLALGGVLVDAAPVVPFTPGDVVVSRFGTGSAALTSAAVDVFLDEYTPTGTLVQSVPLPTAVSGANKPLTNSGSASSNGALTLSSNGQFLTIAGYGAVPGTTGVTGTTSATVNRVIGLIDANANVDTSTALTDGFSGDNFRAAVTDDGTHFWASGTASSGTNGGVRYVASVGATTSTQLSSAPTNTRIVNIVGGQLYTSSSSGAFQGVAAVGTNLPTTSGQTTTQLAGFPTASGPSPYDYFFADANTLYVSDDRNPTSGGGLQKWVLSGGTWGLKYTLTSGLSTNGLRGLTGSTTGGVASLFAITGDQDSTTTGEQTRLVNISDVIADQTVPVTAFTTVASSATNEVFRGVDFAPVAAPEPAALSLLALGGMAIVGRRRRRSAATATAE